MSADHVKNNDDTSLTSDYGNPINNLPNNSIFKILRKIGVQKIMII